MEITQAGHDRVHVVGSAQIRLPRAILWLDSLMLALLALIAPCKADVSQIRWQALPPLPDAMGLAAGFAGVSNGALIVAGGANFWFFGDVSGWIYDIAGRRSSFPQ
jgi:hypothetical protein